MNNNEPCGNPYNEVTTDCRSEEGITIGLVDSLISICRILAKRDLEGFNVGQALCDLVSDEDFNFVMDKGSSTNKIKFQVVYTYESFATFKKYEHPKLFRTVEEAFQWVKENRFPGCVYTLQTVIVE